MYFVRRWFYRLPFVMALFVLFYLIWAVFSIVSYPHDGLRIQYFTGLVQAVDISGPSFLMVQPGDIVKKVDDLQFSKTNPYYQGKTVGTEVNYVFERSGEEYQISYVLVTPNLNEIIRRIMPISVALLTWIVGVMVLAIRPVVRSSRLFFILAQVITISLITGGLSHIVGYGTITLFRISLILIGPLAVHYHLEFPIPINNWKPILIIVYSVAFILISVVSIFRPEEINSLEWYEVSIFSIRAFLVTNLLLVSGLLIFHYIQNHTIHGKGIIRIVSLGWVLGVLPLSLMSIVPEFVFGSPVLPYHVSFLLMGVIPLSYGFVFFQNTLQNGDDKVSRAATQVLSYSIVVGLVLILVTIIQKTIPSARVENPVILTTAMAFLGLVFSPVTRKVQIALEKTFYGEWYDFWELIRISSHRVTQGISTADLISNLFSMARKMQFQDGVLYWKIGNKMVLRDHYGHSESNNLVERLKCDGILSQFLSRNNGVYWQKELIRNLSTDDLEINEISLIRSQSSQVWLPLISRAKLRGLLILGSQHPEWWVSDEDLAILRTMAAITAVAGDNIELIGSLRNQLSLIEQTNRELSESQRRLLEGRETERLRLARDLHDGPVQGLHAMRLRLRLGQSNGDPDLYPEFPDHLLQIIHELRDLCTQLRPPALQHFGLKPALESLMDKINTHEKNLAVAIHVHEHEEELPEQVELALYRISQEALNNIIRHADAKNAIVRFSHNGRRIFLEIRDDGCGFNLPAQWLDLAREGHLGILGMAERAESIGGQLIVHSSLGNGTLIRVLADLQVFDIDSLDQNQITSLREEVKQ